MPFDPQRPGLVDELLERGRGQPVPSGGTERPPVRPLKILELGLVDDTHRRLEVLLPRVLATDDLFRGELGNATEPNLGACVRGAPGEGGGELVDMTGGRVVDDGDLAHACGAFLRTRPTVGSGRCGCGRATPGGSRESFRRSWSARRRPTRERPQA